ncbi:hypothetical protein DERF_011492 [Dermatophagoides farinae]|uniref:Uncharacterized protein n=1 Tax=Dermatophagoides farinae TaxID=6954 RepID=A0A922HT64_DERFA|nr:hypothetical protein DERF_011492 [Dermatophagoides farinae]
MDNSPGWARIPLRCASYDEPTVYWPWTRRVEISCGGFYSLVLSSKIFVFNTVGSLSLLVGFLNYFYRLYIMVRNHGHWQAKDVSPNAELQTGSKQQNINASSSSSSETSLEKRLIYGSNSQMSNTNSHDHSTTYNDDDMQFSPILDNRKDKRNLTTTIEKINNNCNDNNSNLSYASDTDVMSAQLALNELMDVNGTIKDGTKLRVIAALNTILALQKK